MHIFCMEDMDVRQHIIYYAIWSHGLRGFSPQANIDHRLSVKLVPTLADRGCRVVSATNPHGR
jgi:hypothetical protein